jgi:predicted  nucleic acid-binding Zn-ribbon protein
MMAKTTEEKIAELSVLVNDLKQKFPQMEHSMSEISNTLTREQMNIGMLTKQYDKLYEVVEDFKELQFSVQKLNDDTKRFSEQIEVIKSKVEEVIAKENSVIVNRPEDLYLGLFIFSKVSVVLYCIIYCKKHFSKNEKCFYFTSLLSIAKSSNMC